MAELGAPTQEIPPSRIIVSDEADHSRRSYTECSVAV